MIAVPLGLLLQLIARLTVVPPAPAPLNTGVLTLIMLGFLWWARLTKYLASKQSKDEQPSRGNIDVTSLVVVLAGLAVVNWVSLAQGSNLFLLLAEVILVLWLWRRSLQLMRRGMEFAELSTTFKVCFGGLLLLFLIILVVPSTSALLSSLAAQLPLFFLCGLVSLSLARLEAVRHVRLGDGSQADPTRNWLLALTLLGSVLVVLVIGVETLVSFNTIEFWLSLLNPIWNILGVVVGWILYVFVLVVLSPLFYAFSSLIDLIFHGKRLPPPNQYQNATNRSKSLHAISPEFVNLGRWILLAAVIVVVVLLVRAVLRHWFLPTEQQTEVDEVRERLDARSLLREQWQAFWRRRRTRSRVAREPLEPGSARAHYRALLDAVQADASMHERKPTETPAEYEVRLLPLLREQAAEAQASQEMLAMQELTRVYMDERYGARRTDEHARASLDRQVPRVIQRLTGKRRARRGS
jgi:hypothetical protein